MREPPHIHTYVQPKRIIILILPRNKLTQLAYLTEPVKYYTTSAIHKSETVPWTGPSRIPLPSHESKNHYNRQTPHLAPPFHPSIAAPSPNVQLSNYLGISAGKRVRNSLQKVHAEGAIVPGNGVNDCFFRYTLNRFDPEGEVRRGLE